jgi:activator of 2-hydroxyglutaryl-CoA dehydratase/predicted nucleotide-binding protein (sugar kinase/HSP70/actin superfamily)
MSRRLLAGLDVGSTTVKAVVAEADSGRLLWRDYQRHETRQAEKALEFLRRFETEIEGFRPENARLFLTGSGGAALARLVGGKFVQEVNAVALAVEKLHPECGSVIELGGQDAKIIIFREDPESGRKKKIPSMNDKCAGGTGAVIDKIAAKLRLPPERLAEMGYRGLRLHPVAGKCGVFAETDINGLQKSGVPAEELMASLFEAIVMQNLTVLTRGNTLRPVVLLLGGPNTYLRGLRECWQHHIPQIWRERRVALPEGAAPEELIRTPENAQYFAALGAVEFGRQEEEGAGRYRGLERLEWYVNGGREQEKKRSAGGALAASAAELEAFRRRYSPPPFRPAGFQPGQVVEAFIGLDGGSTSTKAALVSAGPERSVLAKAYQLSRGNPIEDAVAILAQLEEQVTAPGARLEVLGVGVTGYAKDILKDVLAADAAIVETVAHTQAGLHFHPGIDVICDVGGQDIKIILLKNGRVKDFRLNTQCSAGNGYFLQSTAQAFGYAVEEFAEVAFQAAAYPEFGYGCAVFMQSDIVDFQRQGWRPEEIMAGLCAVLPKNIWLYVSQIPNLASLGRRFLLQGGTQYNLAAVKAQVDFIEARFKGQAEPPEVIVHPHCGEAGAIGAALEAARLYRQGRRSSFIGLAAVRQIRYKTTRSEATRCYFCKNNCLRTFIDVKTSVISDPSRVPVASKVPIEPGAQRLIIATCEKGTVENLDQMRAIKDGLERVKQDNPNFAEIAARAAFRIPDVPLVADPPPRRAWSRAQKARRQAIERRARLRIGIPRVLNLYSTAPLFTGYFAALGIQPGNIVFSDYTSDQLYREGAKRGAIDPCFPSKLAIPHVHNLIYVHHAKKPLDLIFFPMIDDLPAELAATQGSRACPTVTATPEAVKAAFTKEGDLFAQHGLLFLDTFLNLADRRMLERQLYRQFHDLLGLAPEENARAVAQGYAALERFRDELRGAARRALERLEREDRIGLVLLGRPYHNDPGVHHGIPEELQKLGYPIFTQDTLPLDEDLLERLFGQELRAGEIPHPLAVCDVWKNSYSENTSRKIWAAKYAARHPNLAALELSSFKCGHDAPIYSVVEEIIEMSGTPYFCFKDIDENKPAGSIKIRIETIAYFLERYREDLRARKAGAAPAAFPAAAQRRRLEEKVRALEADHRAQAALLGGALPRIDVPLGSLSAPQAARVAAD